MAHQKTPTCLLLTPEGTFHSFGYTARDYYHDLDPEEARDWLYFEKFKMKIHSATVSSVTGKAPTRKPGPGRDQISLVEGGDGGVARRRSYGPRIGAQNVEAWLKWVGTE